MAKISISLDDELYRRVHEAAGDGGVSGWITRAAEARLRAEALHAVADEIAAADERCFSDEELAEAGAWLQSSSTAAA